MKNPLSSPTPYFAWIVPLFAVACGEEDPKAPEAPEPEPTVSFSMCVERDAALSTEPGGPVSGVVLSVLERPEIPTTTVNDDGCGKLEGLPRNEELMIAWTKPGFGARARSVRTGTVDFDMGADWMVHSDDLPRFAAATGQAIDWAKPYFGLFAMTAGSSASEDRFREDVELRMNSASASVCPIPKGWPEIQECGADSDNLGVVSVHNVDEGFLEVQVDAGGAPCRHDLSGTDWRLAWEGSGEGSFSIPLVAGYETFVNVTCD